MDLDTFAARYPKLYHATDSENVPFIRREGLLSAEEIARRAGFSDAEIELLLSTPRKLATPVSFPDGATALLRDQIPLRLAHLQRRFPHVSTSEYTRALARRVYFWCSESKRTNTGLSVYRGRSQAILIFDTAKILIDFSDQIELCRVNSGTIQMPSAVGSEENRNPSTMFRPIRTCSWKLSEIKEVTLVGSINSIQRYLIDS